MSGDQTPRRKGGLRPARKTLDCSERGESGVLRDLEIIPATDRYAAAAKLTSQEEKELAKLLSDYDKIAGGVTTPFEANLDRLPTADALTEALQCASRIVAVMACSGDSMSSKSRSALKNRLAECEQQTVDLLHCVVRLRRDLCR